jgi:hypothetical protein
MPVTDERDLAISNIQADLLNLQSIRASERNPDYYSSGVTESILGLMSRKFAPAEQRLRDVIAREEKIPEVLAEAKQNLNNPPKIYTEVALEQLPGIERFFSTDVPAAFSQVKDKDLLSQFKKSNAATIEALKSYEAWLRVDLLPAVTW